MILVLSVVVFETDETVVEIGAVAFLLSEGVLCFVRFALKIALVLFVPVFETHETAVDIGVIGFLLSEAMSTNSVAVYCVLRFGLTAVGVVFVAVVVFELDETSIDITGDGFMMSGASVFFSSTISSLRRIIYTVSDVEVVTTDYEYSLVDAVTPTIPLLHFRCRRFAVDS